MSGDLIDTFLKIWVLSIVATLALSVAGYAKPHPKGGFILEESSAPLWAKVFFWYSVSSVLLAVVAIVLAVIFALIHRLMS